LPSLIRHVFGEHGSLFKEADFEQWQKAESRLRAALADFARAAKSTYQGRLFVQDALEGLRLIDLTREPFDVVVMNPPFGELAASTKQYVVQQYPRSKSDLFATFVERGSAMLRSGGLLGAITNKTGFFLQTFEEWRSLIATPPNTLATAVDLGFGVLDTAVVETMMYTICRKSILAPEKTTFVRLTHEVDKPSVLQRTANEIRNGDFSAGIAWDRSVSEFSDIPRKPLCYWVSDGFIELFRSHRMFAPLYGHIYQGIATGDNFRFLRCRWEVKPADLSNGYWLTYAKGGTSTRWISDFSLVVRWRDAGKEIKANAQQCYGSASRTVKNESTFLKPGVTYTQVTVKGFFARALPAGCVFDMKGPSVQFANDDILEGLGIFGSLPFRVLAKLVTDCRQWHPTNLMQLPYPALDATESKRLGSLANRLVLQSQELLAQDETSCFFIHPFIDGGTSLSVDSAELENEVDKLVASGFGTQLEEFRELDVLLSAAISEVAGDEDDDEDQGAKSPLLDQISYAVGVAFTRWDIRLASGQCPIPAMPNPLGVSPAMSPGMLEDGAKPFHTHDGILVDDKCHPHDLAHLVEEVLDRLDMPVPDDVRRFLQRDFFAFHLQRYSKSRRKAPIYWPLATASGNYTLWLYYPTLSSQTLYTAINDFVEPRLKQVGDDVAALRNKGSARTSDDEKQFETLQAFELELIELRDTLLGIAPGYQPNHDDGVQITAAPLWPLFRNKPWQKILKDTWAKLEKGDYDWAHLAMTYWPGRVREKCKTDKSLAIAHDLEALYVEPEPKPKKTRAAKGAGK
jgi:hypothetical protein